MNWVKTYESFIVEAIKPSDELRKFEKLVGLPEGIGIITSIEWDSPVLILTLENKVNAFDLSGVHDAIEKHKGDIKKKYPGIKDIQLGTSTIHLT